MTAFARRGVRAFFLVMLLGVATSCSQPQAEQYKAYIQGWNGLSTRQLMRIWGPPQKSANLADGSTLMEYRERTVDRVTVPIAGRSGAPRGLRVENRVSWCVTRFVARNGVVESSSFEGSDCKAP